MNDNEILAKVKNGLGITGTYQDEILKIYINEVKAFMLDSGVPMEICKSSKSIGCYLQGVIDLWNYSSGESKFSPHFQQRLIQLATQRR